MWWSQSAAAAFLLWAVPATSSSSTSSSPASYPPRSSQCRCFPGDACWPSAVAWSNFNESVDGTLIKTIPLATPCHNPSYSAAECDILRERWLLPQEHYESSSSIMAPWFTNETCDPFHAVSQPCTLGNYVVYSVNISKPEHISKTLAFAQQNNIRVVVRNTGHDYNGKSTGAGAIAIWTHNLKDREIIDYNSSYYQGKAIKIGAGVQGFEAYKLADQHGLQVVGGECPTVGIAGGYSQGGGHSSLASRYGLGADQTLEWEVIDGTGHYRVANRYRNSDLYWALCGGGGSTYGVVWSMTSKAHPGTPVSGFNLTFTNDGISQDTFYKAVGKYHATLPSIVDAGAMSVWYFTNTSFSISPLTGPNIPVDELTNLVKPFTDTLTELGVKYTSYSQQYNSFLDEYNSLQGLIEVGTAQYGGWLMPRSVVETNNNNLTAAYRYIIEDGATFIGVGVNVSKALVGDDIYNSVLPAWRDTLIDTVITTPWHFTAPRSDMAAKQLKMTNDYIPRLKALAPESGAYMNEADFRQPDFQQAFFGENYQKLQSIKAKYDPYDLFYAITTVNSDQWTELEDGRLCKVH
ncbi:FAD/FMN-containing isoamyl alcohol oxidase MreA [Talaromyces stipitatus ATCC 10500]|uniref:FAD/FMN-containing isoamyl alcohol oxidase MreA n=1 Tax=Talaromyces stipitatus (strain ATCC 10500 / CBS 375.48 / QM 6759 / NRRL 1006) TaxID=441959 RepID=B8LTM1_TALSN|nr:FAD/FMN-containing isoamyl alcohol oxidase MreA [Talaromyces stipitatus ATCC 10500]EED23613.1 FAD/FMN-containing isoamyl alcohol oxidase MreA [Talaromyces stipitatus ATCC 10500]